MFAPSFVQSSEHIAFYYSVAVVAQATKQLGRECFYILFFIFFSFCQRLCDLTKRQDDIAVADMVADMEVHIVADMEVDKVADMAPTEKNEVDVCTKTKLV